MPHLERLEKMKYSLIPLMLTLAINDSSGCSCLPPPPPVTRANEATAAFIGRIKSESIKDHTRIYEIEVLEVFSGKAGGVVRVSTSESGASCGVQFSKGKEYLIFCHGDPQNLRTGLC
jgi:hypothetical protein